MLQITAGNNNTEDMVDPRNVKQSLVLDAMDNVVIQEAARALALGARVSAVTRDLEEQDGRRANETSRNQQTHKEACPPSKLAL